ncbi:DUF983 domain-containing protein [Maribacter hydrothermalis]|jgi:uncharacterized protein (DUF983 family)|uniref:DUF983 domain-containing protein n=1 Tax=Maribacter hydrothermalis TaxID=1836467 RepID=A0A1B7YZ39_9FLAO|nr:DUF983 domain-containing protein [Maribacter hydrothermalis]APQ16071.1 DUF983 domain-containing protein [Maribacter hydrothermalis]OBR35751.1 DUF983 domain-containing protein [Maribacter hydrothermalis]
MIAKGSKLYSIIFLKCPRCHKGKFLEANPYKLSNFNKLKERCPKCDLKYSIEPSFYTGSMYVSYAVGIAVAVAAYVLTLIFGLQLGIKSLFITIVVALVLTMPWIAAVSKSIWANMFFKFDKELAKKIN